MKEEVETVDRQQDTIPPMRERWDELKAKEKGIRIRNAADRLGVSEAELLCTLVGETVTRLAIDSWAEFYTRLRELGRVMVLTRNDHVVHEKTGEYATIEADSERNVGITTDGEIELRLLFQHWRYAFAVNHGSGARLSRSFQFFDRFGRADHKVYLRNKSGVDVFDRLVDRHASIDQSISIQVDAPASREGRKSVLEIDLGALRKAWKNLTNIHAFNTMLRSFGLGRLPALKLVGQPWARQISNNGLRLLFERISNSGVPIMVFVGNPGCVQIHAGPIARLADYGRWFNVLDPGFNLHLNEAGIDSAWVVTKRVSGHDIRSLELFDRLGESMIQVFRVPYGDSFDPEAWTALLAELPNPEF